MPVKTISEKEINPSDFQPLLNDLKAEWKNPREWGLPIIIEDRTPRTKSVRLYVIWDRWTELPRDIRSQIINEAFREIHKNTDERITLSLGYDVDEAVAVKMLPYKIVLLLKAEKEGNKDKCEKAMIKYGAWKRGEELELRFAELEDAEKIYELLKKEIPGDYWVITQEMFPDES
jgi:hypothetical protein